MRKNDEAGASPKDALQNKKTTLDKLLKNKIFAIFIISLLIEVFVCNYRHFDFEIPAADITEIDASAIGVENVTESGGKYYKVENALPRFHIYDINKKVKSIYLDIAADNRYDVSVVISVRDDASDNFKAYREISVLKNVESSKYIKLNTAGTTKEIIFELRNLNDREGFTLGNINLNSIRPFDFNMLRFIFIFAILCLVYALRPSSKYYKIIYTGTRRQGTALCIIAALHIILLLWICVSSGGEFGDKYRTSVYNEAAQGWIDGQLSLPEEPNETLRSLENPYDASIDRGPLKWDMAYYKGKYYMYFGVVPLATIYYPAKLLFGTDFIGYYAQFIYALMAALAALLILENINRLWFRDKIPFIIYAGCLALLITTSGLDYLCREPYFYQLAQTSALAFGMLGTGLWLCSIRENTVMKRYLLLGSLCMALSVGCRPNYILYSLLFIPLFFNGIIKKLKKIDKELVCTVACAVVPYLIVGSLLMLHNYMRFDSPFSFGNDYQITEYDMNYIFDLSRLPLAMWVMYIQPPVISNGFPFVSEVGYRVAYQGQFYLTRAVGGIFCNPVLFYMFGIKRLKAKEYQGVRLFPLALLMIAIAFVQSVIVVTFSGFQTRYLYDFLWCYTIVAIAAAFALFAENRETPLFNILVKLFLVCLYFGMFFNIFISFRGEVDSFRRDWPALYYAIERAVSFWL